MSVLVSMFMYWGFNYWLYFKSTYQSNFTIYGLSYFFAYFSNIVKVPFGLQDFEMRNMLADYFIYPITMTILLNSIVLIILHSTKQELLKKKADDHVAELTLKNLLAQKQTLTQQLQPHFLFNALSVLKSLITTQQELAVKYITKLSEFLRYAVDSHQNDLVSLESELQFVHNYLDLQKIRFGNSFDFSVNRGDELIGDVPVLAIQTLIENIFKHNYFTKSNPLIIEVDIFDDIIRVKNSCGSIKLTERKGTGLANLKKRYSLYGEDSIHIDRSDEYFTVTIPIIRS